MTGPAWSDLSVEGRRLRRLFKMCCSYAESTTDDMLRVRYAMAAAYIADKSTKIIKVVNLEPRIRRLEQVAALVPRQEILA